MDDRIKAWIAVLIGLPLFVITVFKPFAAILIMNLAVSYNDNAIALKMLAHAHTLNPKNKNILTLLGDIAHYEKKYQLALWAYGTGISMSPGDGLLRFKYGASLAALGFDGTFAFKEALTLEPNNPHFIAQMAKLLKNPN